MLRASDMAAPDAAAAAPQDGTGSGDVDTSEVQKLDEGSLAGINGSGKLRVNPDWKNPSGIAGLKCRYILLSNSINSHMHAVVYGPDDNTESHQHDRRPVGAFRPSGLAGCRRVPGVRPLRRDAPLQATGTWAPSAHSSCFPAALRSASRGSAKSGLPRNSAPH